VQRQLNTAFPRDEEPATGLSRFGPVKIKGERTPNYGDEKYIVLECTAWERKTGV